MDSTPLSAMQIPAVSVYFQFLSSFTFFTITQLNCSCATAQLPVLKLTRSSRYFLNIFLPTQGYSWVRIIFNNTEGSKTERCVHPVLANRDHF